MPGQIVQRRGLLDIKVQPRVLGVAHQDAATLEVAGDALTNALHRGSHLGRRRRCQRMLPLSLSSDHRVIDGALAVRFTSFLGQCLSNVDRLLQAIP